MAKRNRGRKDKLTPKIKKRLLEAIKMGVPIKTAAIYAGISEKTYYNWKEKGEKAKSKNSKYLQFLQELKRAEAVAKISLLADIKKDDSWQSSAWILERRWPEEFGKQSIDLGDKIEIVIKKQE